MNMPQKIAVKPDIDGMKTFRDLTAKLRKVAERIEVENRPKPSGINQFAMCQDDFDRLMGMRDVLDMYDSYVDDMSCEVEIIENYIGTLMMHLGCARDCIDAIHSIVLGEDTA